MNCWRPVWRRLRFNLRSLAIALSLLALFLAMSLTPFWHAREARRGTSQLTAAGATLNRIGISEIRGSPAADRLPTSSSASASVPFWLQPFLTQLLALPADSRVEYMEINDDRQIELLRQNVDLFPDLQAIAVLPGVSQEGLLELQSVIERIPNLYHVQVSSVLTPPGWFQSLRNVRSLWLYVEDPMRGFPLPDGVTRDIAALPRLENVFIFGWSFDDADAGILSESKSISRVFVRGTAVTEAGEQILRGRDGYPSERAVFRN